MNKKPVETVEQLVQRVGMEVRRMGAQSVVTSEVVAKRFGLHTTDLECLDLIYLRGRVTAGDLAKATGLTSGAVTALIDRLEAAGYVARESDPSDRRRTYVGIRPDAIKPIEAAYAPMQTAMFQLWSTFSANELKVIERFLAKSTDLAVTCVEQIRSSATPSS